GRSIAIAWTALAVLWPCAVMPWGLVVAAEPEDEPAAPFSKGVLPFLKANCFHCHGNGKSEADLVLDKYQDAESLIKDRKTWDHVAHMVRSGEMPPKERPRPTPGDVDHFLKSIDATLASLDCSKVKNVGRVTLRRVNT